MKTILKSLLILVLSLADGVSYAQSLPAFLLTAPHASSGGGGGVKNFVLQYSTNAFPTHSVTFTPHAAGDVLVAFVMGTGMSSNGVLTVSDSVNSWVTKTNFVSIGQNESILMACAFSVSGSQVTITYSVSGTPPGDQAFCVLDLSGVTALDQLLCDVGATPSMALTTTETDMFVSVFMDDYADTSGNIILNPGLVSPTLIHHQINHDDAQWSWLNSSAGFAAGTWTVSSTGEDAAHAAFLTAAFK